MTIESTPSTRSISTDAVDSARWTSQRARAYARYMSAATLGTKLLTNELTKKIRNTRRNGGREPGVSATSRSIQRKAISDRSRRTSATAAASHGISASAVARMTSEGWTE